MTDHSVYEEQICALLDGKLSAEEEASIRAHLDGCAECRAFLAAMEAVCGLAAKDLPEAPADMAQAVMARVRAESGPEDSRARIFRFPYRSLAAAAAAALVLWAGARSIPIFHAGSADSAVSASGAVQEFSAASSQSEAVPEEAAEAETYGAVNGVLFAEAEETADEESSADAPMSAAAFDSAAAAEEPRDAGTPLEVTIRDTEILLDGQPVTLDGMAGILAESDARTTGVELVCDGAAGETEAAVRDLLGRLEIPVL